jgi:hypothetical protein
MLGAAVRPDPFPATQLLGHPPDPRTFRLQHSAYRYIATEIDMIHVRRAAEHDSPAFEVIVREGKGETRHHVTMSREMCERLTAGKHTPERYPREVSGPQMFRNHEKFAPHSKGVFPRTFVSSIPTQPRSPSPPSPGIRAWTLPFLSHPPFGILGMFLGQWNALRVTKVHRGLPTANTQISGLEGPDASRRPFANCICRC